MKSNTLISIIIPTFNGSGTIKDTLESICAQGQEDIEVIISDDNSTDNTLEICQTFKGRLKILIYESIKNEGYSKNIKKGFEKSNGDYAFLLGQDDLIALRSFDLIRRLIEENPEVTCFSRPYFWFETNPFRIVRQKQSLLSEKCIYLNVSNKSTFKAIANLISTTDQLSGLIIKKSKISHTFHKDIFTSHVYPFTSAFLTGSALIIPYHFIAVRIESSQSRNVSWIYDKSPIKSWKAWLDTFFPRSEFPEIHSYLIKILIVNFGIGLLQIRNFSSKPFIYTLREIKEMIKLRWKVLFDIRFISIFILVIFLPKNILRVVVDLTKRFVNKLVISRHFKSITSLDVWSENAIPVDALEKIDLIESIRKL
jgi:glycosyltransferase involved in cell wall biosynthesis